MIKQISKSATSKQLHVLKWILCFIVVGFVEAQNQQKHSLNGDWAFKTDPYAEGESANWFKEDLNTSSWDRMNVPGNWDLRNEYSEYVGNAWYSRTFTLDEIVTDKQVRLVFQSVYNDAKVWVNGHLVGNNDLGFLPFQMDITEHLYQNKANRLTILVNNTFKSGAMWNWGGIRRPVWLEITPKTRIEFQHIDADPDLENGTAKLDIKVALSNSSEVDKALNIQINIQRQGKKVAKGNLKVTIPAHTEKQIATWSYTLPKSKVELWHFDFPHLYDSEVSLIEEEEILHSISDRFGIRKVELKGLELLLNGERIRPVGFNVVPEDRFTGNTLPMERIKEDVDLMKSLGANMARLSHVSLPKEYLDYLDEKGILVFEEVGLWGKDALVDPEHPKPKEWLRRIIETNYNHPSIVGWSVGNEIGHPDKNPKVNAYVKSAVGLAKSLDPNRLVVYASNTAQKFPTDAIGYTDLGMINAYGGWENAADHAWEYHQKPIFISEFGHRLNDEDPNIGDIPAEKMMNSFRNKDYVLGASLWTLNDYRSDYHGDSGWKTPPSQNRAWGVVTSFRKKKRGFYSIQNQFAPIKNLSLTKIDSEKRQASVSIKPREKLDIPANVLRNSQIEWTIFNDDLTAIATKKKAVKTITPGDDSFEIPITWDSKEGLSMLNVSFLDPQGYKVLEEVIHFQVPKTPEISFVNTANTGVRLFFEKSKDATEYYVQYTQGDSIYQSPKTINSFVEIEDEKVKQGETWSYQLFAVNSKGESKASTAVDLVKDEDELPPIVWDYKYSNKNLSIAYSVSPYDYAYEVEYGSAPNVYSNKLTTKVKGVLNIPNPSEEVMYFRMRVIKQWGFASEWTQEFKMDVNHKN